MTITSHTASHAPRRRALAWTLGGLIGAAAGFASTGQAQAKPNARAGAEGASTVKLDSVFHGPGKDDVCSTRPSSGDGLDVERSVHFIPLPSVRVKGHQGGGAQAFTDCLPEDSPVLLNFIFTSCTTICPPMASIFSATQAKLQERRAHAHLASVSIDPGHDTPARLREFAARFSAAEGWNFHTGSPEAITAIQKAFNVNRPDKMGHTPVTFVRPKGSRVWVRLDGFATPERLLREAQV